jgi:hypothetical protein
LVIKFLKDGYSVKVVPHKHVDLPLSLIGHAAVYLATGKAEACGYYLKGSSE